MCDGEIILENSPLHQYLQQIGYDDTQTITRTGTTHHHPTKHSFKQKLSQKTREVLECFTSHVRDVSALCSPHVDVRGIRNTVEPHLLTHHRGILEELAESGVIDFTSEELEGGSESQGHGAEYKMLGLMGSVVVLCILVGVLTGFCHPLLNTVLVVTLACVFYLYYNYKHTTTTPPTVAISTYTAAAHQYKQLCKVMLSYLRDCLIARTPYASGVTWSKLDHLEQASVEGLQCVKMRRKMFDSLKSVYSAHKALVEEWLACAPLISDVDCVARFICLQEGVEPKEGVSSHTLRYYLKLVEHMGSEVLWRLVVSTYPGAWSSARIEARRLHDMLKSLQKLAAEMRSKDKELREYYDKQNNPDVDCVELRPGDARDTTPSQILHQLQLLHSSLNVATIRCRDTHQQLLANATDDLSHALSLIRLNVDLADATLQTLASLTSASNPDSSDTPSTNQHIQTLEEGKEAVPIVPYKQQGNLVFSGVNDGTHVGDPALGAFDSDEELEMDRALHKRESKLMLAELRHVIENNPTCLYEEDYDEFKKTGLLNPTKQELKEMYEGDPNDDTSSEEGFLPNTGPRMGFNPFSFPPPGGGLPGNMFGGLLPGQQSLFREMEVCEAYGDLSEDEEEQGDDVVTMDTLGDSDCIEV